MTDDKFTLGNFDGLEDLDDVSTPSSSPPYHGGEKKVSASPPSHGGGKRGEESPAEEIAAPATKIGARNDNQGIIPHPTAKASPQASFKTHAGQPLLEIELENVLPNEFQPRRIFNEQKLKELAESIKEHGIIQPLVVTQRTDGRYEIVVGERRFRAAKLAGLKSIPAFVIEKVSSETKLELALIENIQRADLNPIEEAKAYQRLNQEFGLGVTEIAHKVGKSIPAVSNLMRLLQLPAEIQRALVEGAIAEGQARPLLTLKDKEEMLQMFRIILKDQMKVRDIEQKVRDIKARGIKVKEMFTPDPFLESLENILRHKLGTRVEVAKGAKGGKITIEFFSDEELNDIVGKIT